MQGAGGPGVPSAGRAAARGGLVQERHAARQGDQGGPGHAGPGTSVSTQ